MINQMNKIDAILVYVTTSSQAEAVLIAKTLVEQKLCACVNIIPEIKSIYSYNGRINDDTETMLVIKSTKELFNALEKSILKLHSYEVPEIIATSITHGHNKFINWIQETVRKDEEDNE
ncbi:divalent cation tolerance protein [Cryptosporidium ryanae]|uniref:divalent cation tolerance protein n=1 Tax=Cryptosporidium ryanae TaxID=515981 RepID=UPI003519EB29|nr:divalent cation tolerance protein [Cryptosporidium ryanae]